MSEGAPGGWTIIVLAEGEDAGADGDWVRCDVIDMAPPNLPALAGAELLGTVAGAEDLGQRNLGNLGKSKYRGIIYSVTHHSPPWRVCMYVDGKRKMLDGYSTEEEAARSYDVHARRLGRPERQLNFPQRPARDASETPGAKQSLFRGVHIKILKKRKSAALEGAEHEVPVVHFTSSIRVANRSKHLGTFDSEELAALAYDRNARELGRDNSQLNFPGMADYSSLAQLTDKWQ
ncbi:hypothetical protein T492DRAFT_344690 [Pavlovales sp. CCMP2436]|nr:hypothetical protein T492DRAFT_344690 [Pavlovales sp. CCMP2436]|mmetsp:Transcript_37223/g.92614  ORF Transcript_37223/g.92614 Transcript_37223/m.92614 type:complete len:233 (+) Transcript_37223:31-729(+)